MSASLDHGPPLTVDDLIEQLRQRIDSFVGLDVNPRQCVLVKTIRRRFCQLYLFNLSGRDDSPEILVKVPVGHADVQYQERCRDAAFVDRPRLFGRVDPESKAVKEYEALRRVQTALDAGPDERFGVVRVFDLLPPQHALVMRWVDQPSLRKKLYAAHRLSSPRLACDLETVFGRTGALLRTHHRLPALPHCETRNTTRDDFLAAIDRFVSYLDEHLPGSDLRRLQQRVIELARGCLPETIPTGQVHGDFAPRNIFVDAANRVSLFDTLGRFEAPIYEDVAKMLMCIHASGPQLISAGVLYAPKRLKRFEDALVRGYFGDRSVPVAAINLFSVQLVLEHWAAIVYRHREHRGAKRIAKQLRRRLWQRGFQQYLNQLLERTETAQP
ncbi:phosphotransferase [Roseimaritima sediminicola]|uniref:phosphotransferase n=1 Tax=Roseimaritima sediminicola TaxID=2662066 RepID=UPI0012982715|nr:phosphotransferase [Roseimaritima sediminicola]